ncbi:MAG: hypothetical protein CMO81_00840 [Waddliaceae bacterium]|nr:hypothetical protein [Waddliaceae bacterium]
MCLVVNSNTEDYPLNETQTYRAVPSSASIWKSRAACSIGTTYCGVALPVLTWLTAAYLTGSEYTGRMVGAATFAFVTSGACAATVIGCTCSATMQNLSSLFLGSSDHESEFHSVHFTPNEQSWSALLGVSANAIGMSTPFLSAMAAFAETGSSKTALTYMTVMGIAATYPIALVTLGSFLIYDKYIDPCGIPSSTENNTYEDELPINLDEMV